MKSIKALREMTGLSQQAFSDKYKIPKRTIENWEAGSRVPPAYVVNLLERAVVDEYGDKDGEA